MGLRIYFTGIGRSDLEVPPNYSIGVCVHRPTRMMVRSNPRGYYHEENGALFEVAPFVPMIGLPDIAEISYSGQISREMVKNIGVGQFTNTDARIGITDLTNSDADYKLFISAKTVDGFNGIIEAIRNGTLKKDGEELTSFEKAQERIFMLESVVQDYRRTTEDSISELKDLKQQLGDIKNRNVYLEAELEKLLLQNRVLLSSNTRLQNEFDTFISGVANYAEGSGTVPEEEQSEDVLASGRQKEKERLVSVVTKLKNKSFWQMVFGS